MEDLLTIARGPLFRFCFIVMVLGLLRHIVFRNLGNRANDLPGAGP